MRDHHGWLISAEHDVEVQEDTGKDTVKSCRLDAGGPTKVLVTGAPFLALPPLLARPLSYVHNHNKVDTSACAGPATPPRPFSVVKMLPKILIMGQLYWAKGECDELFKGIAEVQHMESSSRQELFRDFAAGGRYNDVVGIYHEHLSGKTVGHPDGDMMRGLPSSCKWFAHKGAGYDSVDVAAAKTRGITVSNTPGAVDEATATTAVFLLIATMRRFSECEALLRSGNFAPPNHVESDARDLSGKTIGILGMGGIGTTFVNYIRPFGMRMLYHNRRKTSAAPEDVEYVADLYDMLGQVDVLMISIPLSESTRGFIEEKEIRSMKKGAIIVNTARGPIIDEEAMIRALQDGHLASVGLDVFVKEPQVDQRLIDMPQVTLLPHVGTENQDARRKMEVLALTNLRDYLVDGAGRTPVPECR